MGARFALAVVVATGAVAHANPKQSPSALVGASEIFRVAPKQGFVDDPVASDGQHLAYVISDGSQAATLHVWSGQGNDERVADISAITLHPVALALVGDRVFVVGERDGKQVGALIALGGAKSSAVYKLGPATGIAVIQRDGKPRVAIHRATAIKTGTRHEVELVAIETGRRVALGPPFELDAANTNAKLELRVNHWADGMSRAFGVKGGEWDKKEDQRSPDVEAIYDLIAGKIVERQPISDLVEQRKRYQALADAGGRLDFVRSSWDLSAVQLWRAGKPTAVELDQPLASYDPKSLQGAIDDRGAWLALQIDPVNAAAVARKKADPEYFDVFRVADGKATRKVRILATGARLRFGRHGDHALWVLERSKAFERGGVAVVVYRLE